jgi:Gas vesicle synthesis protein GvpL/GvpF
VTLYLYALVEPPARLPDAPGLDGSAVSAEPLGALDAVVSRLEAPPSAQSQEHVLAHARVVDELAALNDAVLPVRFGRGYADASALREAVEAREGELRDALDRVRGCVELGLRVLAGTADRTLVAPESGRDYLQARLDERQRGERLADELDAPLAALSRAATRSVLATPHLVLSAAYLVPRDELDEFRRAVGSVQSRHPELSVACTGPWAPYSFATADAEAAQP